MAMFIKNIVKSSFNLYNKNTFKQLIKHVQRPLYTANSMGMNGYLNARDFVKSQFINVDHLFFNKMHKFVDNDENSMIFTEDLKTMLHLIEKNPEHIELLYKMIKKYHAQNNLRFGNFVFGTVVMRALYYLDEPDLALKIFKDPELHGFFDQLMTYQLLMDLLYNHKKYADVREIYSIIKTKNINGIVHPANPFILTLAACYKENTKESFDYAKELFKEAQSVGFIFPRRGIIFLSALALKQNIPSIALEIASMARNVRYIDIRCIKVEAYTALKRFDEVAVYFRNSLQNDMPYKNKQCFFKDTIEKVEAAIENENSEEITELRHYIKELKLHDYVQPGLLEEHISCPIDQVRSDKNMFDNDNSRNKNISMRNNQFTNERKEFNRPGLRDIV